MRWASGLVLALALAWPCAAADAPTVRPLDDGETRDTRPPASEPARTLPPTVAVCQDEHRCWTAARAEDCARDEGRVYRVVLGDAGGRDAVVAMDQCRAAVATGR
jgi:hypothetical protein